jgi:ketosteroid isomerase-like protein
MAMTASRDCVEGQNSSVEAARPQGRRVVRCTWCEAVDLSKTDLARQIFEAFNQRDVDAGLELVTEDVEFVAPTGEIANEGEPYVGHAGMRKYYDDVARVWEELEVTPSEIREVDDAILALGRVYGRGEGGYIQDSPAQWVMRFRGDKVRSIRVFTNRTAAFAEVGLSESSW